MREDRYLECLGVAVVAALPIFMGTAGYAMYTNMEPNPGAGLALMAASATFVVVCVTMLFLTKGGAK
jgi:uncharacterized membrane protein